MKVPACIVLSALVGCGDDAVGGSTVDAAAADSSQQVGGSTVDAAAADSSQSIDAAIDAASVDLTTDDFERPTLGPNWMVVYPPPPNTQVQVVGGDVCMGPGPDGFSWSTG